MKRLPLLALSAAGLFWGVGFPLSKLVLREIDAASLTTLRLSLAALIAAPFVVLRADARALLRSPWVWAAGALYGLAFLVQFEGLARTSVSVSALLMGALPAMIAAAVRLMGQAVSRATWAGVAAATAGAALIAQGRGGGATSQGISLCLGALMIFTAQVLVFLRAPRSPTLLALPGAIIAIGAATVLAATLALHGAVRTPTSAVGWTALVSVGILCTLAATVFWQFALTEVSAAKAGVFVNLEPLIGSALGIALFHDPTTPGFFAGGALILAGSLSVVLGERRGEPAPPTFA